MAKTTFSNGTVVTAAFLNAINNPVFVDVADDDGEIPKITNANLSTASGQLLPEWQSFRDMLLVTQATTTSISYTAGVVTLPNGTRQVISAGTVGSLTGSTTYYIFVDNTGTVTSSTTYPLIGVLLAAVVTSGNVISTITDLRPRFEVKPVQEAIKLIGGNGSDGDFATGVVNTVFNPTGATSVTLSRETYYFRNFTVSSGHSVTLSAGVTYIYCSGTVNIAGTITVNTALAGGPNTGEGGVYGSNTSVINTTVYGPGGRRGTTYNWFVQPCGSSSCAGNFYMYGTGLTGSVTGTVGGAGGGGLFIQAAGGIILSGTIQAVGGNAQTGTLANSSAIIGGAGGGSGGLIHLSSLLSITCNSGSTLSVRGGNGADGQKGASVPEIISGGGAGGGGWIVLTAPSITNNGTMNVSPGSNGANTAGTTFAWRGNGGASFAGLGGGDVISATPPAAQSGILVSRLTKPVA